MRKKRVGAPLLAAPLALMLIGAGRGEDLKDGQKPYPSMGSIERLDPAFDKLIPKDAKIEKLADGFLWSEGPVWVSAPKGGYLLFSDIPRNRVMKWQEGKGVSVFLDKSGYTGKAPFKGREPGSNGLALDKEGRLILCQHGNRQVARRDKDGKISVLIDKYRGKRLNSPNDLVCKSNGDLYFTDPPYGLPLNVFDPNKELPFQGVYRLTPKGELTLLTKDMTRPNGIAFAPDEKTLYVANSDPLRPVWMAFEVKDDGTLGKGRVFFDASKRVGKKPGLPDGLKVDRDGNVFATGPGGVLVFSPDGKHLGTLATGVPTANCAWGDDGSVLYITANKSLCRVKTSTKGLKR